MDTGGAFRRKWKPRAEFLLLVLMLTGALQGSLQQIKKVIVRPLEAKADTSQANRTERALAHHLETVGDVVHEAQLREVDERLSRRIDNAVAVIDDVHVNQDRLLNTITSMNSQLGIILREQGYSTGGTSGP